MSCGRIECTDDRLYSADAAGLGQERGEIDGGERDGVSTVKLERIKVLEREVKDLCRPNEILKLARVGSMSRCNSLA